MHTRPTDIASVAPHPCHSARGEGLVVPLTTAASGRPSSRLCQMAMETPWRCSPRMASGVAEERRADRRRTLAQMRCAGCRLVCACNRRSATNWAARRRAGLAAGDGRSRLDPQRGTLSTRVHMAAVYFVADSLNYLIAGTLDRTDLTLGNVHEYMAMPRSTCCRSARLLKSDVLALAGDLELPRPNRAREPSRVDPATTDERHRLTRISSAIWPTVRTAWRRRWRCGSSG